MINYLFRGRKNDGAWATGGIVTDAAGDAYIATDDGKVLVEPSTIGVDTGLRDNGGKSVFTGDVVATRDGIRYLVDHHPDEPAVVGVMDHVFSETSIRIYASAARLAALIGTCRILGNIHDDPKLFKR